MFRAIGRWGAQVKSRIKIPFLTNLFGSKNKDYSGIDDDDEEIFIDAKEDPTEFSDTEEDVAVVEKSTGNGHVASDGDTSVLQSTSGAVTAGVAEVEKEGIGGKQLVDLSVHRTDTDSSHEGSEKDDRHSDKEEDDHHDSHKDTKKIIRTESKTNGMTKSPSTSTFKKVHRRISSLTQKQYSKLDNNNSDSIDHLVHESDAPTNENSDTAEEQRKEKKPGRRKKIAKRARRSLRGSWKWMKRGLMGYAHAFNTPTMFIVNVSGAAATRRY